MEENDDELQRLTTENLRLGRAFLFLKREVILLRSEREDRERKVEWLQRDNGDLNTRFRSLQKSYDNIKEMQNHISYQYTEIAERFEKLEGIILSYGKSDNKNT